MKAHALALGAVLALGLGVQPAWGQPSPSPDPPGSTQTESPQNEPAEEIPESDVMRYPPSSVRVPLIIGGAFVTLASYGITVASALTWDDVPGADSLLIPVVGPWVALAQNDCAPEDNGDCTAIKVVRYILYIVDGIAQAGGLGLIGEGIFMTTEADAPPGEKKKAGWSIAPTPIITPRQTGVGFVGTF